MKRKAIWLVLLAAIIFAALFGIDYCRGYRDFKSYKAYLQDNDYTISVKSYSTGEEFAVTEAALREDIINALAGLSYGGITDAPEYVLPQDNAYSVIVSSPEHHFVIIVSNTDFPNYIIGDKFYLRINAPQDLYDILEKAYANAINTQNEG